MGAVNAGLVDRLAHMVQESQSFPPSVAVGRLAPSEAESGAPWLRGAGRPTMARLNIRCSRLLSGATLGTVPDETDDLISRLRAAQKPPVTQDPVHAAAQERATGPHEPWDVILSQSGSIALALLAVPLRALRKLRTGS